VCEYFDSVSAWDAGKLSYWALVRDGNRTAQSDRAKSPEDALKKALDKIWPADDGLVWIILSATGGCALICLFSSCYLYEKCRNTTPPRLEESCRCATHEALLPVEPRPRKDKVFLCHSGQDKHDAVRLWIALEVLGFSTFFDLSKLRLGNLTREDIARALYAADFGIILIGADFFTRNWCKIEANTMLLRNDMIVCPLLMVAKQGCCAECTLATELFEISGGHVKPYRNCADNKRMALIKFLIEFVAQNEPEQKSPPRHEELKHLVDRVMLVIDVELLHNPLVDPSLPELESFRDRVRRLLDYQPLDDGEHGRKCTVS